MLYKGKEKEFCLGSADATISTLWQRPLASTPSGEGRMEPSAYADQRTNKVKKWGFIFPVYAAYTTAKGRHRIAVLAHLHMAVGSASRGPLRHYCCLSSPRPNSNYIMNLGVVCLVDRYRQLR
jgi:hypothetical protein